MERREGILQMTLHPKDADLKWGISAHEELSYAFYDIARDHENRCVILTGAGHSFCAEFEGGGGPGGINITGAVNRNRPVSSHPHGNTFIQTRNICS